jgi:trans-aconitate methyltransferase
MADARSLPFDSEFDIVISNATLHWVKDHRPVLRGIARSLVPGGMALLSMGGRGNGADFFAVANDMTRSAEWQGYFAGFEFPWGFHDAEEYGPWCEAAGLRPRRIELIPRDMLQDGIEGLEGWVRTTWMPYTHRVPEDRRPRFIRQAVDRYVALHPLDADGRARVRMVRLEVEAVRASS